MTDNISEQMRLFVDYCKDKQVETMEFKIYNDEDSQYDAYTCIKLGLRTDFSNNGLVFSDCWVYETPENEDSYDDCLYVKADIIENFWKLQVFHEYDDYFYSTPMVSAAGLASRLDFSAISDKFYNDILKYWEELNMDEMISEYTSLNDDKGDLYGKSN